ncbi:MAG: hypothetical protein H6757_01985 [Candidatus Omnitrophica bacterium]|nr:hypothetical protein [Candidatus Omnitrophota bacterium]
MPNTAKQHCGGKLLFAIVIVLASALYFRTYALHPAPHMDKQIRKSLIDNLKEHVRLNSQTELSKYPPKIQQQIIDKRADEILKKDPRGFENMVQTTLQRVMNQRSEAMSPRYLSGADPYYYYALTEKVIRDGVLGEPAAKPGTFINVLRSAPAGNPDVRNLHPVVGAFFAKVANGINPGISLMRVTAFVPLFFVVLIVLFYFLTARLLGTGLFAVFSGCLVFILSPMVIQRSAYGWYDTDVYNFLFPILILGTCLSGLKDSKQSHVWGFLGGVMTGFYPLFWQGWSLIFMLITGSGLVVGAADLLKKDKFKRRYSSLIYTGTYIVMSAVFGWLFLGKEVALDTLSSIIDYFRGVTGASIDVWPNLLVMVGETEPVSLTKWVYLCSHYGAVAFGLIGLTGACILYLKDREKLENRCALLTVVFFLPIFIFSLKSQRITMFSIFPLSLLMVLGVSYFQDVVRRLSRKIKKPLFSKLCRAAGGLIILGMIVPRSLIGAHVAGIQRHLIMNDTWYHVLKELEKKSSENSIVYSWWPPGYFISAIAHRAVVIDGGTHAHRENFWIAKALMTKDEKKAAGFLRMLASGGNQAADFLESKGLSPDETVGVLDKIVGLKRKEAFKELPENWNDEDKNALLDKTHAEKNLRPGYVLVYDDVLHKNLELQILSRWNFQRAQEILSSKTENVKDLRNDYVQKMLKISAGSLPYETNMALKEKRADIYIFQNGLVYDAKSNEMHMPLFGGRQTPVSFYFRDDRRWNFKEEPDSTLPVSAVLMKDGEKLTLDFIHKDLLSTFLFQLYYFDAESYDFIAPVSREHNPDTGATVAVFHVDWDKIS